MMNRFYYPGLFLLAVLVVTPNAFGQGRRFELFVGYSPLRNFAGGILESRDTLHGWNASLLTRINPWLAVITDFSGHYDGSVVFVLPEINFGFSFSRRAFMSHSGLIGPQVTLQHDRFKPFARALFGASRVSVERAGGPGGHRTGFTWGVGGGLDWEAFEHMKIRVVQVDYLRSDTHIGGESLRSSFGLVIPF